MPEETMTPCMRPDPEDVKVTCPLPKGHNVRRRPCSWMRTNRPRSRPALMAVDLHPEPTVAAMPVAARTIPEFAPRRGEIPIGRSISQAISDVRTRMVELRIVELEGELSTLRESRAPEKKSRPRRELRTHASV
jgi:hypothetical protein